jgi:hypothetical protein
MIGNKPDRQGLNPAIPFHGAQQQTIRQWMLDNIGY